MSKLFPRFEKMLAQRSICSQKSHFHALFHLSRSLFLSVLLVKNITFYTLKGAKKLSISKRFTYVHNLINFPVLIFCVLFIFSFSNLNRHLIFYFLYFFLNERRKCIRCFRIMWGERLVSSSWSDFSSFLFVFMFYFT